MVKMGAADFSGWATKANLKCSDGRTIMPDAFKHQDKETVPLVWSHSHNEPTNVLGHVTLENRDEGVYCHAYFNGTEKARAAKEAVAHKDVTSLSIYANKLVEKSKMVVHGMIREVSLVLAGANDGAKIDFVNVVHDDGSYDVSDDSAVIFSGLALEHSAVEAIETKEAVIETDKVEESTEKVEHAEESSDSGETVADVFATLSEKQKNVVYYLIGETTKGGSAKHSEEDENSAEVQELFHSLNEKQTNVVVYMIGQALEHHAAESNDETVDNTSESDNSAAHADDKEGSTMTHNVFEQGADDNTPKGTSLSHEDAAKIFKAAKKGGSLKEAVLEHAEEAGILKHGIDDIDVLFPDARAVVNTPEFVKRRTEWVARVLGGTKHTPFSRIKSLTADLTLEAARAKGYIKGNVKKEEFFRVAKRVTTPQTVYKKQKLDRDDILDITDFDVVVWLKAEMRLMLEEEIARAVLVGDGRSAEDEDKIQEDKVRPIASDADLYVTRLYVNLGDTDSSPVEAIDAITLNRRHYRGSGTPTFFTSETFLAQMLLVKDTLERRIYNSVADIAAALRVSEIVTCEILDEPSNNVLGIMVNLQDYVIGSDKGGDVSLFDDFDIDYNQYKYLIETRVSGALVRAKSALVVLKTASNSNLVDPVAPTWDAEDHTVTVATTAGITYKNRDTNATLTTGAPVTLAEGDELVVIAVPTAGNHLASNTADEFLFTYEDGRVDPAF